MYYDLLCKLNADEKHLDIIACRMSDSLVLTGGTKQRQRYIVLKADLLESVAGRITQFVNCKPRFQIALKSIDKQHRVSRRKIKNRTIDYQPFLEPVKRRLVDRLLFRKPKKIDPIIFTIDDIIDRAK